MYCLLYCQGPFVEALACLWASSSCTRSLAGGRSCTHNSHVRGRSHVPPASVLYITYRIEYRLYCCLYHRAIRLPAGVTTLMEEEGPDPGNANSAVSVAYQVGAQHLPYGMHTVCTIRCSTHCQYGVALQGLDSEGLSGRGNKMTPHQPVCVLTLLGCRALSCFHGLLRAVLK